ncbi:GDP-mannose 4,6-dehydratase [Maribacter sp. ANRC-HE7]|uniref:GDP-mannose 4,6-dehydratase n=1 Tax=Maribacter aquimaris TaxID=2737171 RepID=A0ABR7V968_9FLAO|nr:GDP-mannose 4,6-dehydratase [Maribacter aquimaris]
MKLLITGGAGFIGSHVVRKFVNTYKNYNIHNLENLRDIENHQNYTFFKGNIVDADFIEEIFKKYKFDGVVHLAAESHVDRSM